ncbi:MAG TPA: hypothetical protein VMR45_02285 [Patescibacteria group bacterium]|jgi:hypothetical protein|nr:hypothetical protein [Patescibacteria group bacterium]
MITKEPQNQNVIEALPACSKLPKATRFTLADMQTHFVQNIKVRPQQRSSVHLGGFSEDNQPRGFSIEITPRTALADLVSIEVTSEGTAKRHRYVLEITNNWIRPVTAEIWQL